MLTPEQTEKIKGQIVEKIQSSFPNDKKGFAISQVESMDSEQLETFLRHNNMIKNPEQIQPGQQGCVFCSIVSGKISSFKVNENEDAIAILEINPISKGHVIIVPKEHVISADKLKKSIFSLAKAVSKRIKMKLEPKDIAISSSNLMGHEILNIIPVYDSETESSDRKHANHEELSDLQKILEKRQKISRIKRPKIPQLPPTPVSEKKAWLPRRIP